MRCFVVVIYHLPIRKTQEFVLRQVGTEETVHMTWEIILKRSFFGPEKAAGYIVFDEEEYDAGQKEQAATFVEGIQMKFLRIVDGQSFLKKSVGLQTLDMEYVHLDAKNNVDELFIREQGQELRYWYWEFRYEIKSWSPWRWPTFL